MVATANGEAASASMALPTRLADAPRLSPLVATAAAAATERIAQPRPQAERSNVRNSLLAGSCSGILSTLAIYPMDVIRTKMQTSASSSGSGSGSGGATAMGPLHVLRTTLEHGGIRALYTGLALPLAAQAVYKATVFSVNNLTQNAIMDYRKSHSLLLSDHFVCGLVGGAVNGALFVTPVELVRNQLIAQHSKLAASAAVSTLTAANTLSSVAASTTASTSTQPLFRGSWDVIRYIAQKQGPLSLWRGISWTVARDGIGCGCFFYTIAWTQQRFTAPGEKPSFPVVLFSGGLAGLSYWVVSLPMDSVKTWVQSSNVEGAALSTQNAIRKIYVEDGMLGLWQRLNRGWQVAYGRGIPSSAITIATYSFIYDRLQRF